MNTQKHIRLSLPYTSFIAHPIGTIKQLLSKTATVLSYSVNSVVTNDETVLVDVNYTSLLIDAIYTYFVPISGLKKRIPDSSEYVVDVNGCHVKINDPSISLYHDYIPIRIIPVLAIDDEAKAYETYYSTIHDVYLTNNDDSSSNQTEKEEYKLQGEPSMITYRGLNVLNPLTSYCSAITSTEPFEAPAPIKLYTKEPKITFYNYTPEATVLGYKKTIPTFNILSSVTNVKLISSFNEVKGDSSVAYVIEFDKLPRSMEGIIMIQPERQYNLVLYYPHSLLKISEELHDSIGKLIEYDYINLLNINHIRIAK